MILRKLMIDPGHTGVSPGGDPGAVGNGLREADLNLDIALKLRDLLKDVPNLQIALTRTGHYNLVEPYSQATDLKARTDMANEWGADLFLSVHSNSFLNNPAVNGYETFVYVDAAAESFRFADIIHRHLVKHWRTDRTRKTHESLYVLKYTKMPAVLVENGFISNADDAKKLADPAFRQQLAQSMADAIFEAYPHLVLSQPQPPAGLTPIIGEPRATLQQGIAYMDATVAPAHRDVAHEIARVLWELAPVYNVRPEVAAGLILHETGKLAFGGLVVPEQNNFGGIGATGVANPVVDLDSEEGAKLLGGVHPSRVAFIAGQHGWSFATVRDGVEAVVQHLYAYATAAPLPRAVVDPRYVLVSKGSARHLEELGGKWAVPGYDRAKYASWDAAYAAEATYGQVIRNRYVRPLIATEVTVPTEPTEDWKARALAAEAELERIKNGIMALLNNTK